MVSAPVATVANIDMNVVYKGYDNKMEISVPGIAESQLRVSAIGASITKSGNQYICRPSADKEVTINVSAEVDGKTQSVGQKKFRVRPVPSPTAFLQFASSDYWNPDTQGVKLKRRDLYDAEVVAIYPDGMLNANFRVKGFTLNIQKGQGFEPIKATGNKFSSEQIESLKKLKIGQVFFINNIEYTGARSGRLSMPNVTMP
jgi:gliding motility-associated protein GldM